jgi:hypothetical protein
MDLNNEGERRDWIASWAKLGDLPIYPLKFPAIEASYASPRRVGAAGASTSRRSDSGIFELWRPEHPTEEGLAQLSQQLSAMAAAEDPRILTPAPDTGSEVIAAEWESRLSEHNLPVIGPGGRIMIAREASGTTAEIVIRKRGAPIASYWRSTDDLMSSLSRRITHCAWGCLHCSGCLRLF